MKSDAWYKRIWSFFVETWNYYRYYRPTRMASSLSYYGLFALVPLLVLTFWLGSLIIKSGTLESEIISRASFILGSSSANFLQTTFDGAIAVGNSPIVAIITIAVLLFLGITGFDELKQSLDELWETPRELHINIMGTISRYVISLITLVVFALIFVAFLFVATFAQSGFKLGASAGVTHAIAIIGGPIAIFIVTIIGAFIVYSLLPDRPMPRTHLLVGSALTAFFLTIGNVILGYYLAYAASPSTYGVAGSIIAVLLWFYYSSLIFLFGASATWIYNKRASVQEIPFKKTS